jgi:hypothetical protein
MADTTSNILITTNDDTASMATDYGTSGTGFTASHIQIAKLAFGDTSITTRVSTSDPLPMSIYGITGTTIPISGTIGGSGNFTVVQGSTGYFRIAGTTASTLPVGISGTIQGYSGAYPVGISGSISIINTLGIFGISGATAIGITGGRRLNHSTDSVYVHGNVGLSGGLGLIAADDSVRVYGADLGDKVLTRLYASDGTTIGYSGDALKVAITNAGVTFSVSIAASVGITNAGPAGLMVRGTGVTSDYPITIQGTLAGGALEVAAYTNLPVSINNTVTIDDADLIDSLESSGKPLNQNLGAIRTNTNIITTINDKLNAGTISSKITEIVRPASVIGGRKVVTTNSSQLVTTTSIIKVGVHLKSPSTNTDVIFIGGKSLLTAPSDGYPLDPGESIFIECDALGKLYARSNSSTQVLNYIAS